MSEWLSLLAEPFQFAFMLKAMLIAVLLAVPMGLLSCFLVLKGWSLMGDAVSHAVLPGVVLAYVVGVPLALGAFAAGMACALATGYLDRNSRLKQDTVMGIVFSSMFALGLVIYVAITTDVHLDHILFGNILGISAGDIWQTGIIAAVCTTGLLVWRKDLLLNAFDPQHARAIGLPVGWLHYGLLAALSLTIVGALTAAGIILAIAFLIGPGATAFLVSRRFSAMLAISVFVAGFSSLAGVYLSYHLDSAPAPTIVLVMTTFFLVAFARHTMQGTPEPAKLTER
jgi:manganese/iron transport system permease protein